MIAMTSLAGCFGAPQTTPPPAATQPGDGGGEAIDGDTYVAPVFNYAGSVGAAATADNFAEVNPFEYENPWV